MTTSNTATHTKQPTVLTLFASKGGAGKTTLAANLGGLLCDFGNKVIIIDTDPQASCSQFYRATPAQNGMVKLLSQGGANLDSSFISSTNIDGLDIIISDFPGREGGAVMSRFGERDDTAWCLTQVVRSPALAAYDYVIIDTQGAVGKVQRSAVFAANILIAPFTPSRLDVGELFSGTLPMLEAMSAMPHMGLNMPARMLVVANKVSPAATDKTMLALCRETLSIDAAMTVLDAVLKQSTHFQKNLVINQPAHRADRGASEQMHRLLWEIFPQYNGQFCNDWQREIKTKSVLAAASADAAQVQAQAVIGGQHV